MSEDEIWSVPLPPDAEAPFKVFVNAVELSEDAWSADGRWIRIRRTVRPQPKLGFWKKVTLGIGVGVYGDLRGDQVDVQYHVKGAVRHAANVTVVPPQDPPTAASAGA